MSEAPRQRVFRLVDGSLLALGSYTVLEATGRIVYRDANDRIASFALADVAESWHIGTPITANSFD